MVSFTTKLCFVFGLALILKCTCAKRLPQERCDDIAIIGAGISGTYAAWRLRNANKKITIYEFSNRIGGRLYTVKLEGIPDINIELGGMRFYPDRHGLLSNTIRQLRLPVIDFKLGSGPYPETLMYLRGTHLKYDELTSRKNPFRLNFVERKDPEQLQWEMYRNNTDVLTSIVSEDEKMYSVKTRDGIPVYQQSVQSVFHKSISTEAQNYLRATNPFDTLDADMNAAFALRRSPPSTSPQQVKTVASGFNAIPKGLLEVFLKASRRHSINMNHHLTSIRKRSDGKYTLYFQPTVTEGGSTRRVENEGVVTKCAAKVILAINRYALEQLDWNALRQPRIQEYLTKAITDVPAAKLYLAYDYPWWRYSKEYSEYAISDTLLRQTYDFGTSSVSPKSVLQPVYSDEDVSMWTELTDRTNNSATDASIWTTVGEEAIQIAHKYLSEIFKWNINTIPRPTHNVLAIWKSYPFGGAWQKWLPGYKVSDVREAMIKPSRTDEVIVACSAFDEDFGSWAEGALRTVDFALRLIQF